jgi:hypothetical protein
MASQMSSQVQERPGIPGFPGLRSGWLRRSPGKFRFVLVPRVADTIFSAGIEYGMMRRYGDST